MLTEKDLQKLANDKAVSCSYYLQNFKDKKFYPFVYARYGISIPEDIKAHMIKFDNGDWPKKLNYDIDDIIYFATHSGQDYPEEFANAMSFSFDAAEEKLSEEEYFTKLRICTNFPMPLYNCKFCDFSQEEGDIFYVYRHKINKLWRDNLKELPAKYFEKNGKFKRNLSVDIKEVKEDVTSVDSFNDFVELWWNNYKIRPVALNELAKLDKNKLFTYKYTIKTDNYNLNHTFLRNHIDNIIGKYYIRRADSSKSHRTGYYYLEKVNYCSKEQFQQKEKFFNYKKMIWGIALLFGLFFLLLHFCFFIFSS